MSRSEKLQYLDLIGVPFKENGRDISTGLDCYGLCVVIMKRLGRPIFPKNFCWASSIQERGKIVNHTLGQLTKLKNPEPYCGVVFYLHPESTFATHMGILLEDCTRFIHILHGKAVIVSRLSDKHWNRKLAGFYRYDI